MTIIQALNGAMQKLQKNKIPTPHFPPEADLRDAEILLSHIIKKPREYILAHPEKKLTQKQVSNFKFQISRRIKGEPAAYITGHKEFYGLNFYVNKNVLIPRPETELMADEALKLETQNLKHATFIDIGTGSGCIIISLFKQLKQKNKNKFQVSSFKFYGIDISKPALAIAHKNAKLHNVHKEIKFLQGNLIEPVIQNPKYLKCLNNPNYPVIITANLPYLTHAQIKNSPSIKYEPKLALSAGADGLKYYRRLFKQIKNVSCSMFHVSCYVLCEIDPLQTVKIKQLIKKEFPNCQIQIKKDLRMLNRMVICSMNSRQD